MSPRAEVKESRYFLGSALDFPPPLCVAATRVSRDGGVRFSPRESPVIAGVLHAHTCAFVVFGARAPVCFFPLRLPANAAPSRCFVGSGFPRLSGCERTYGESNDVAAEDAGLYEASGTFILYKSACVWSRRSLALLYISKQISLTVSYKARQVKGPILLPRPCPPTLYFVYRPKCFQEHAANRGL